MFGVRGSGDFSTPCLLQLVTAQHWFIGVTQSPSVFFDMWLSSMLLSRWPPFFRLFLSVSACSLSDGLLGTLSRLLGRSSKLLARPVVLFFLASHFQSFMCTMAEASLRQHAESKHPKSTFELCFPTYAKA